MTADTIAAKQQQRFDARLQYEVGRAVDYFILGIEQRPPSELGKPFEVLASVGSAADLGDAYLRKIEEAFVGIGYKDVSARLEKTRSGNWTYLTLTRTGAEIPSAQVDWAARARAKYAGADAIAQKQQARFDEIVSTGIERTLALAVSELERHRPVASSEKQSLRVYAYPQSSQYPDTVGPGVEAALRGLGYAHAAATYQSDLWTIEVAREKQPEPPKDEQIAAPAKAPRKPRAKKATTAPAAGPETNGNT